MMRHHIGMSLRIDVMRIQKSVQSFFVVAGLMVAGLCMVASPALANDPPPPPKKGGKETAAPAPQPGLTGAKLLRCDPGFYPNGNNCKPARPGTYVAGGATFPSLCPAGTTSEAKARTVGECFPVGGAPAKPEPEKPKSGH
jgi:hypothetical protein